MQYNHILYEIKDKVALITLNREDVLNSFNSQMALELQHALDSSDFDSQIRAILITGKGRAFSAGQDLDEAISGQFEVAEIVRNHYNPIIYKLRHIEKPIIAAVNGVAAGAGANIAFACDIVIASETSSFIQSFSKIGLIPDSGGTYILPRLVGMAKATAMAFLAEKISAAEAEKMGLIYRVVEPDDTLNTAMSIALKLSQMPTKGLGLTKRAFNKSMRHTLEEQLKYEEELQTLAGKTYDYKEGVSAFIEKRKPEFKGE